MGILTPVSSPPGQRRMKKSMQPSVATRLMSVNPGRGKPWASIHAPMQLGFLASYARQQGFCVTLADELAGQDVAARIAQETAGHRGLHSHDIHRA